MQSMNRREFIIGSAASLPLAGVARAASSPTPRTASAVRNLAGPVAIASANGLRTVARAVELMKDAMRDRLDIAFLVSADSDLAGPVAAFRELWPAKRILAIFPPGRGSIVLERLANGKRRIRRNLVLASQMPDEVIGPDGYAKHRPPAWRSDGQGR